MFWGRCVLVRSDLTVAAARTLIQGSRSGSFFLVTSMPNRIIRDGILSSERVDGLSLGAEVFYRRLLSVVDDYGRFTANLRLLRSSCYPLRFDHVTDRQIKGWLGECGESALVLPYTVNQKPYLEVQDFRQQVRAKCSKYPQPPTSAQQMPINCIADATQKISNAHLDEVVGVDEVVDVGVRPPAPAHHRFQPPTPAEVTAYALTLGYALDGHRFCDHYTAKGWVVGKSPMKNWQAAVRTWRQRDVAPVTTNKGLQALQRVNAEMTARGL